MPVMIAKSGHLYTFLSLQWVCRALMFLSIASAIVASITLDTYTAETPKRLFLQHIIRGGDGSSQSAVYAAASSDATPIDVVLQNMDLDPAESNGQEWLVSQAACIAASFAASSIASFAALTAAALLLPLLLLLLLPLLLPLLLLLLLPLLLSRLSCTSSMSISCNCMLRLLPLHRAHLQVCSWTVGLHCLP